MWALSERVYREKAYGGWMGKNIGGTLGGPVEGRKELLSLEFYPELPGGKPLPNDDLDLQLVWLHTLEQYGVGLTATELGQEWVDHVRFPYDEYGYALTNLRRGIIPPVSGWFGNPFVDCMGSPIRSEIWAMIAPGLPELAAYYAWQDAVVDHAGGEGVWGEILFAAIESAAFIESDPRTLIDLGLGLIPSDCRVAKAVRHLIDLHEQGVAWKAAREEILLHHGNDNFTDAPQNIAFTLLGWLYGSDFEDALLKATNCGYDTDCTAATLGAILGIIHGASAIPEKWSAPIGDAVVLSPTIIGFEPPSDLQELTDRTLALAEQTLAKWHVPLRISNEGAPMSITNRPKIVEPLSGVISRKPTAAVYGVPSSTMANPSLEVTIDYGDEGPSIGRAESRPLVMIFTNRATTDWEGSISLVVPPGWKGPERLIGRIRPGESLEWEVTITASDAMAPTYNLHLELERTYDNARHWTTERVGFTLVPKFEWEITNPAGEVSTLTSATTSVPIGVGFEGEKEGWWHARTKLHAPHEQKVNLMVATSLPMRTTLNGDVTLEVKGPNSFMPAYHRGAQGTVGTVTLQAGTNELEIAVRVESEVAPVVLALINPRPGMQQGEIGIVSAL